MAKAQPNVPAVPVEMSERDRVSRGVIVGLNNQNFDVMLLTDGEIVIHMAESDYTVKITKKKARVVL